MSLLGRFPTSRTLSSTCLHQPRMMGMTPRSSRPITRGLPNVSRFTSTSSTPSSTSKEFSKATTFLLGITLITTAYGIGVIFPPNLYTLVYPREAPPSAEKGSKEGIEQAKKLESQLWEIPLVKHLASNSYPLNSDVIPLEFRGPPSITTTNATNHVNPSLTHYMIRPYVNIPEKMSRHSLTAGLLQGPGKLAIPPLLFVRTDEKAITGVSHLGRSVCGHDGIVHGGLIATLFDDSFFRTAVANFPARIGVTAWLKINYRAPTKADQFVVFQTKVDKVEGRKVFLSGRMEDLEGNVLVEAEALFVQPKYAHLIQSEEKERHFLNRPAAIARTLEPVADHSGTGTPPS